MVVGPLLDLLHARKEQVSPTVILGRGNLLVTTLPFGVRVAFWLTNLPYYLLAVRLADEGVSTKHCIAVAVIAVVSTCFHGAVLFGASLPAGTVPRLMILDVVAANGYGLSLMALHGVGRIARLFALPVCFLSVSAVLKRRQQPHAYAALHGAWHLLSAAAIGTALLGELSK
jgi:hypothetical protein